MTVRRVLVIDDEAELRELVVLVLTAMAGWKVVGVGSATEALGAWAELEPELILCDMNMPEMNGLETLEVFRASGIDTPFVFLTAETAPQAVSRYRGAGALGVLEKPFDPADLADRVRAVAGWD